MSPPVAEEVKRQSNVAKRNYSPFILLMDISRHFVGEKVWYKISKLDGASAYWSIPMREDIPKTALFTPQGQFEFMRMPTNT